MQVPCCKCMPCRIRRRSEWTVRLFHELDYWKKACFVTLTYSPEKLPQASDGRVGTLVKRHLQLFHKRLRYNTGVAYKYYAVGEYGEHYMRPHYHGIYFGFGPQDKKVFEEAWLDGCRVHIGTVTHDSIQYVAGYVEDKLYGDEAEKVYGSFEPPFPLMSKNLGERFVKDHADQILERGGITVYGKEVGIPRYYKKKLNITKTDLISKYLVHQNKIEDYYGGTPIENFFSVAAARLQNEKNVEAKLELRRLQRIEKNL